MASKTKKTKAIRKRKKRANKSNLKADKKRIEKKISTLTKNGEKQAFYESVRLYSAKELENIIGVCGFKKIKRYGSLSGKKFSPKSKRLIIVCEK